MTLYVVYMYISVDTKVIRQSGILPLRRHPRIALGSRETLVKADGIAPSSAGMREPTSPLAQKAT